MNVEGQKGGLPLNISLNDARDLQCECGNGVFMTGYRFKKFSKILTGDQKDTVLPIEMYLCTTCGTPLQELLPDELKVKKPIVE